MKTAEFQTKIERGVESHPFLQVSHAASYAAHEENPDHDES